MSMFILSQDELKLTYSVTSERGQETGQTGECTKDEFIKFQTNLQIDFIDIIQGHWETAINPSSLCISNPVFVREFPLSVDEDRDVSSQVTAGSCWSVHFTVQ